jgi:hypothetical protein
MLTCGEGGGVWQNAVEVKAQHNEPTNNTRSLEIIYGPFLRLS